ncbi:MAG: adenosine kinase [Paludibacteraceae bacterium]|nr:adenosine kinase [Paludibacteraceae bacterium]
MKKILGLGNALTDILLHVSDEDVRSLGVSKGGMHLISFDQALSLQQQFSLVRRSMIAGGSAANTVNAIAALGGKASFVGKLGEDEIGQFFRQDMVKNGVENPRFFTSELISGCCTVLITPDSERTMCTYLGAAANMTPEDITPGMFTGYDIFHVEGYILQNHELIEKAIRLAKEAGLKVSIDLASYTVINENKEFLTELVKNYVDIVFANEDEALAYTGLDPEGALRVLADQCEIAIVKIGSRGSMVMRGDENYRVPAVGTKCVDTTGAGDYYAGGFLYALASGQNLLDCARIGTITAGRVCEVVGAKLTDETWQEIKGLTALMTLH